MLNLNASFECKCKMYISKRDNTVRPKKVKFVLHRVMGKKQEKAHGRLTVDVDSCYGMNVTTSIHKDMESGRGKAPTLHAGFILCPLGTEISATQMNMNDVSFLGEQEKSVPMSDWDMTEIRSESDEQPM